MKYYLAPLEGITTFVYRNAVHRIFGDGVDKYYTPFFSPNTKRHKSSFAIRGVLPENNEGICLIPQILTNDADDFLKWEKDMTALGYTELNINIGCPSGTVVSKNRGAGFLRYPERIDEFLEKVFEKTKCQVSVKTRLGMSDPEEFDRLLEVYNKYQMEELIIHARTGDEMYSGKPHRDEFDKAARNSRNPVVYNGDIIRATDVDELCHMDMMNGIMIGRGMIADPSLVRQLRGGAKMSADELRDFLKLLRTEYLCYDPDENHTLAKLKEVWTYLQKQFPDYPKETKKLLKSNTLEEYRVCAQQLCRML